MKILIFITSLIFLVGCKSMEPLEFYTFEKEGPKLPYLIPEANVEIINTAFHYNSINTGHLPKFKELSLFEKYKSQDQEFSYEKDQRIDDLLKFYLLSLKNHMKLDTTKVFGKIQLSLLDYNELNNDALMIPNIFLLGIPSYFGAAVSTARSYMNISLTICNAEGNAIKIYTGEGQATEHRALYYGYGRDVYRVASLKAFRMALIEAFQKIKQDQKTLIRNL